MSMKIWQFNWSIQWQGNINWALSSGGTPSPPPVYTTRLDTMGRVDQLMTILPNTNVHWQGSLDRVLSKAVAASAPVLMAMERSTFRRIFGRVIGRVN